MVTQQPTICCSWIGLGGYWQQQVYHLPIPLGYQSMSIVHLKMANILVACKLFSKQGTRLLIKCDNEAVVRVLQSGRARDPLLGAFARNTWYITALADIDVQYSHVMGKANRTDILYFVFSELKACRSLKKRANDRIKTAFQPKTRRCYIVLFRLFLAFCICVNAPLTSISAECMLSFMEYLMLNKVSVYMVTIMYRL